MRNTRYSQSREVYAFSAGAVQQTAKDAPLDNADLDTQDKCTLTWRANPNEQENRSCDRRFLDSVDYFSDSRFFTLEYQIVSPEILMRWFAYHFGATAAPTGTNANEVQTLTRTGTVTGGAFSLALSLEGRTKTTRAIAFDATAAEIKKALIGKTGGDQSLIADGDVVVTGDWATAITITFGGRLAGADLPLLQTSAANLTGTTPNIAVAETAAGDAMYFPFEVSTGEEKPYFSFVVADKNGEFPAEKFINAVVSSIKPTPNAGGSVSLTVTGYCDYYPEEIDGFTVPPCINYDGLKTSDCRVSIDNKYETLDLLSLDVTLDDGLIVDNGFDSFNPDAYFRAEELNYPISGQIYGHPTDDLGIIVENREKAALIVHFGMPGRRVSLIMPFVQFAPDIGTQYAGTPPRRIINFTGRGTTDGTDNPARAEGYSNRTTAYLLT